MQPEISIIIPIYNEEKNIAALLDKLSALKNIEIIISDGGSTDKTQEVCALYPVQLVSGDKGRGQQLNLGAKHAHGKILFFLHADSLPEKRAFQDMINALEKNHKWGCCIISFDADSLFYRFLTINSRLRARLFSSCYGDQGIFCEREFFLENGGFPDIPLMEDVVFSHKLRRLSPAKVLPAKIITSARRFQNGHPLRTFLLIQKIKLLFLLGISPERLAVIYDKARS